MVKAHFRNIRKTVLDEINKAEKSIQVAVAWFTNHELFEALVEKCTDKVVVELIIINDSINLRRFGLYFNHFINQGGKLYFGEKDTLMHHKFCLIDDKVLINGSYNWTYWAETKNNENITVFYEDNNLLGQFKHEFDSLVRHKEPIISIEENRLDTSFSDDSFFNLKNIVINEYIESALFVGREGNHEMSGRILAEVNKLSPISATRIIKAIVSNPLYSSIYKTITSSTSTHVTGTTYEDYCNKASKFISQNDYINAINVANTCIEKFPNRFSIHVFCGDAKKQLDDQKGAEIEYRKALNNNMQGAKILYYGKVYNQFFFPTADIYIKLNEKDKAIETLKEGIRVYQELKLPKFASLAQNYLSRLQNNELLQRIE